MDLSPDEEDFEGRLLHQAALWDNLELLQSLLVSGAPVNCRDGSGRSALHAAALCPGRCLEALLAAGAEVDALSDEATGGKTPLHVSAERGHCHNVSLLIAGGASLAAVDAAGNTALDLAVKNHHHATANILKEAIDAVELARHSHHATLRELVAAGDALRLRATLASLARDAELIVNMTPNGANTLLYLASWSGHLPCVEALLASGSDGRAHPVTQYCPLLAAARAGHRAVANILLQHFPQAVQHVSVEGWTPLHAACLSGHADIVSLILEHPYPEEMKHQYTLGSLQYWLAVPVNARDCGGSTPLQLALSRAPPGDLAALTLIQYTVPATRIPQEESPAEALVSPTRGISLGIHAIVNKLTRGNKQQDSLSVRPVEVNCSSGGEAALSACVRRGSLPVLGALLAAGARPDLARANPPGDHKESSRRRSRSACPSGQRASSLTRETEPQEWSALSLSVHLKQFQMSTLLLQHGATDPHHLALRGALQLGQGELVSMILATKAAPDPESKLSRGKMWSSLMGGGRPVLGSTPTTAAMVTWRGLPPEIMKIRMSWLRLACVSVNPSLRASQSGPLLALTRLDISNNELTLLPPELFTLFSLKYLNAAQNKLERLPSLSDPFEGDCDSKGRKTKNNKKGRPELYSAPALQEIYLQDNRLEELPSQLFLLPSLTSLDVSNNKLKTLPHTLWSSTSLKELNAAFNLLRDLPSGREDVASPTADSRRSTSFSSVSSDQLSQDLSNSSRSPSIDRSDSENAEEDGIPSLGDRSQTTVSCPPRRPHTWATWPLGPGPAGGCSLGCLSLAHNLLPAVPPALACRAPHLTRLNLAYNELRSMSYVTSYPKSLRQLDLSHNEITCWPSLPQPSAFKGADDPLACYCPTPPPRRAPRPAGGGRAQLLRAACPARRHLRFESLRTLILANNLLTRIQLTTDDDGLTDTDGTDDEDDEYWSRESPTSRLLFPQLSMLDVSGNLVRAVPPALRHMTALAVLNLSHNRDITSLPPSLGLLPRLWSLQLAGCALGAPLRELAGRGGRSQELLGYLLSVRNKAARYTSCKLMLVGREAIGKTSLLECLRQESPAQHRRKTTDHWSRRMGNRGDSKLSTVGVDIGTWTYEPAHGRRPLHCRSWDFAGQQEYYATHQYFLSRRSVYLVVWKITDGKRGLAGALEWLRSIQARVPGSPCIMVGTHYDQVAKSNLSPAESPEALQRIIRHSIMAASDADKLGLPRVLDSVEVSCSTRHNIRLLADIIYNIAYSVKQPGSKVAMLEQMVPASYLALEECVCQLAADLAEPVLSYPEYTALVTQHMAQRNMKFRDSTELQQATQFLHENGVVLQYRDSLLKELVFLRPQWLSDLLAAVLAVREVNPLQRDGIMRVSDLPALLRRCPALGGGGGGEARLGVALLGKFELALLCESVLVLPHRLCGEEPPQPQLLLKSKTTGSCRPYPVPRQTDSPCLIQEESPSIVMRFRAAPPLRRLLLLSYIPAGLWGRLIARLLADQALAEAARGLYRPPQSKTDSLDYVSRALEQSFSWKLWSRGIKLMCDTCPVLTLREMTPSEDPVLGELGVGADAGDKEGRGDDDVMYNARFVVAQEGGTGRAVVAPRQWWAVAVTVAATSAVLRRGDGQNIQHYQSITLEPSLECITKMLAIVTDHVDLLLEDWYPSLGTRFVHTSEGRCLITRLVPCPACLDAPDEDDADEQMAPPPRVSEDSVTSDRDSGVGPECASSRLSADSYPTRLKTAWTIEQCILAACTKTELSCDRHTEDPPRLRQVAPDTLLLDVEEDKLARWEDIHRISVIGRGAFGTVVRARWRPPGVVSGVVSGVAGASDVAVKTLQPVAPPGGGGQHMQAYKASLLRWERAPLDGASRSYCALRQELAILQRLAHQHVCAWRAACPQPLALLMCLAPMGGLDSVLVTYRSSHCRLTPRAVRAIAIQVARALEYLHDNRILYRDLKSENVLVWSLPRPEEAEAAERSAAPIGVLVKLGDYGISRLAPPSGTKGFGGTEGFMAPEIMRYNGEQEYNEKVDCFSYGMLLYEIVTLRQPFEGHEAVKEAILDGARPPFTDKDIRYPCSMLEVCRSCWAGAAGGRPSAAALVSLAAAPDCLALQEAAQAQRGPGGGAVCAAGTKVNNVDEEGSHGWEVFYSVKGDQRVHSLLTNTFHFTQEYSFKAFNDNSEQLSITAVCRVGNKIWIGDSFGRVSVYSASTCSFLWSGRVSESVCAGSGEGEGEGAGEGGEVSALAALEGAGKVALSLRGGRLFLVSSQRPEAEGSFVLTELGTATELCCLTALPTPSGIELWSGGCGLSAYCVTSAGVTRAEDLPVSVAHSDVKHKVTLLASAGQYVYAYYEPGVCVYQWSSVQKSVAGRLDCSKLAPCSESLQSIAIESELPAHCSVVTGLAALAGCVYVGTMWGCLIVADSNSFRPLTIFRPYEENLCAIVPLPGHKSVDGLPMLATFGTGYRPLVQRFAPQQTSSTSNTTNDGLYCLLWRTNRWLPD